MPQTDNSRGEMKLKAALNEARNYNKNHSDKIFRTKKTAVILTAIFFVYILCLFTVPHLLSFLSKNHDDAAILAAFLLNVFLGAAYGIVPVSVLVVAAFWLKYKFLIKEYALHARELIAPLLMERYFDNVKYKTKGEIDPEVFEMFNSILPRYKDVTLKDFVNGNYRDVHIRFCDTLMTKRTDNGTVIVFSGLLMSCEMSSKFNCELFLLPKKSPRVPELLKIHVENDESNRYFDIYTDDAAELKLLLTDEFMQNLIKLKKLFHKGVIRCVFKGRKLYLALPANKNNFEVLKSYERPVTEADFKELFSHLEEVFKILDALKNNVHLNLSR